MKTFLIVLISLLIGGAVGGFLALGFGSGIGAATGLVYGSQVGICVAADTAQAQGLATDPATLDQLIVAAVQRIRAKTPNAPDQPAIDWVANSAACRSLVAKLDQAPDAGAPAQ